MYGIHLFHSLSSSSCHRLIHLLSSHVSKLIVSEHSSQVGHDLLFLRLIDGLFVILGLATHVQFVV
jgi:hypothetical protein